MTDSTSDGMSISTPFYSTRRNIQTVITTTAVRVDPSLVSDRLGLWPASPLTPRQNGGFLRIDEMKTLCTCL